MGGLFTNCCLKGPYISYFSALLQEQAKKAPSKNKQVLVIGNQATCLGMIRTEGICLGRGGAITKYIFCLNDVYNLPIFGKHQYNVVITTQFH